ncbi:MAG: hypothetical protein JXB10_07485 [Pirellulales bacterium]|nr:hypothetical protein [Pirellulales bacterium]
MPLLDAEKTAFGTGSRALMVRRWDVAERAEALLRNSAYLELRNVFCSFREGVLTLRGRVSSYHLKQLAQTFTGDLKEVAELKNQLEVLELNEKERNHARADAQKR